MSRGTDFPCQVMLAPRTNESEALWIFSRFEDEKKRLALEMNPYFYERLPTLPEAYGDEFRMDAIMTFQHGRISVLSDNPVDVGRVFLECATPKWAFGNVWVTNDTMIFKGSCLLYILIFSDTLLDVRGRLVGESTVGTAIQGIPNVWCYEELPEHRASLLLNRKFCSSTSHMRHIPNSASASTRRSILNAVQISSAAGILIRDWREPIRRMLQSRDFDICFEARRLR